MSVADVDFVGLDGFVPVFPRSPRTEDVNVFWGLGFMFDKVSYVFSCFDLQLFMQCCNDSYPSCPVASKQ